jgi:heat shock protein HtpX
VSENLASYFISAINKDMAQNLYSFKDSNIRKTWLIFALFLVIVIGIGWIFSQVYSDPIILYVAIAFSLIMNFVAYWNSDKIALTMSRAHEAQHDQYKELYHAVENLCITAGIPMPKIYVIEDPSGNAFATGRNPKNATIAVTSGLLSKLNKTELEGVIAHELSHVRNYDTLLSTVVVVLVGFIAMITDIFMRSLWFRGSSNRDNQNQIFMIIGIVAAILAPIVAVLIQLAISRKREYLADASGALLTRYPEGLASALEKISADAPLAHPQNSTAHLFFVNPFKADVTSNRKTPWIAKMFMTHPPVEDRIKALRQMA